MCVHSTAQLLHTILHRTDLIIFLHTLQTIIIAPMISIWGNLVLSRCHCSFIGVSSWSRAFHVCQVHSYKEFRPFSKPGLRPPWSQDSHNTKEDIVQPNKTSSLNGKNSVNSVDWIAVTLNTLDWGRWKLESCLTLCVVTSWALLPLLVHVLGVLVSSLMTAERGPLKASTGDPVSMAKLDAGT